MGCKGVYITQTCLHDVSNVHIILGFVEWPPFVDKAAPFVNPYVLFVSCIFVILVIYHYWFEDRILALIVSVPS